MTPTDIPAGLYILGSGGHGRSVADIASEIGIKNVIFVDPNSAHAAIAGLPILQSLPEQIERGWAVFPAVGHSGIRKAVCAENAERLTTLISPSATVGLAAEIALGTFVGRHAHVGPFSRIGMGVIINTGAIVEHDCQVGDFSHVSVNATLAGGSRIGSNVMIGAGATVIDGVAICDNVTVGAGATVIRNIEQPGTYVGTPAKALA